MPCPDSEWPSAPPPSREITRGPRLSWIERSEARSLGVILIGWSLCRACWTRRHGGCQHGLGPSPPGILEPYPHRLQHIEVRPYYNHCPLRCTTAQAPCIAESRHRGHTICAGWLPTATSFRRWGSQSRLPHTMARPGSSSLPFTRTYFYPTTYAREGVLVILAGDCTWC